MGASGVYHVKKVGEGPSRKSRQLSKGATVLAFYFSTLKIPENSGTRNLVLYHLDLVFFLAQSEEGQAKNSSWYNDKASK